MMLGMKHLDAHIRHHAILRFVRALLAPALIFLRGSDAKKYLRMVQGKLNEAENNVREWLAGLALGVDVPQAEDKRSPGKRSKISVRRPRGRSFSVLPALLPNLPSDGLRAVPCPLDTRWVEQRIASAYGRADLLEAVIAAPAAYIRRLALRFLSVRIELPIGEIRRRMAEDQRVEIHDSS